MSFQGANVLITGGLGFVGSNLTRKLVRQGANVTVLDNMLPGHGGNLHNVAGIAKGSFALNFGDVCSPHAVNHLVQNQDVIFHLAGQVNHVASMQDPICDLKINTQGTLTLLEACRQFNPKVRIVFAGTRGSYGKSKVLPVDEEQPTRPLGVYAVSNAAAEQFLKVYNDAYGIASVCLRITNTFGPRHQMRHNQYGIANWFIRQAMDHEPITVMGDGSIQRDYLFIEDLLAALQSAATSTGAVGEIINVGRGKPTTFLELAQKVVSAVGDGEIKKVPFSQERKALEPGHYVAKVTKAKKVLGWEAQISLEQGIALTTQFYREHKVHYWG